MLKYLMLLTALFFALGTKAKNPDFDILYQDIKHEMIFGDLSRKETQKELKKKIKLLSKKAQNVGGKKLGRVIARGFKKTLHALRAFQNNHREVLDMEFKNGLTGREILVSALDPVNSIKLNDLFNLKKDQLLMAYSGDELSKVAFDRTINAAKEMDEFSFLTIEPKDEMSKAHLFTFFAENCKSAYGEEDFFLLLLGYHRCTSKSFKIVRWTLGALYLNAQKNATYMTGLKIGKKGMKAIGIRAQVDIYYGIGISAYIGNGLAVMVDLEKGYGAFAGLSYLNLSLK